MSKVIDEKWELIYQDTIRPVDGISVWEGLVFEKL